MCAPVATLDDTRSLIITTTVDLMEHGTAVEPSLREVARAAEIDEATVLQTFSDWDAALDAAYGERFLQQQVLLIAGFARELRSCRSHLEFRAMIERHLRAAYAPERAPVRAARAARAEILGRCRTRPDLSAIVIGSSRQATGLLGDALRVAQTRGWVRHDLNTEVAAAWILGQVNGRLLLELDPARSHDERKAWDGVSVDAVLAVLVEPSVLASPRRWWRRATTAS